MAVLTSGKPVKSGRDEPRITTSRERALEASLRKKLAELGEYESLKRFFDKYANLRTRTAYAIRLALYFRWLRQKDVTLSPDELVRDNLECVFASGPTDVGRKRTHTDWLNEYVNRYLVGRDLSESERKISAAAIIMFYKRNDSSLFGDFSLAVQKADRAKPAPPLPAEDIRKVLKELPPQVRLPLLVEWQSGVEIHRVLGLSWADLDLTRLPSPLTFNGRKGHAKTYGTFMGRESVEGLKAWRAAWAQREGREPRGADLVFTGKGGAMFDSWLNKRFREAAMRLSAEGIIANGNPRSWHSHNLRHSFETEASHAGVKAEIRDFFLGHIGGVQWVYNHRDELHPEDLEKEYLRIEPFVSLDHSKALAEREAESRDMELMKLIRDLQEKVERLTSQAASSDAPSRSLSREGQTS